MKNLDDYKAELGHLLESLAKDFGRIGRLLVEADHTLTAAQGKELRKMLLLSGWTQADIRAAIAVGEGKLDESFFQAGVKSSKILNVPLPDQERLRRGEKFAIQTDDGIVWESWDEMSVEHRNQLLGPKGGPLRQPHEQIISKSVTQESLTVFEKADLVADALQLTYGLKCGKMPLGRLVQQLFDAGEMEMFIARVQELYEQYEADRSRKSQGTKKPGRAAATK